MCVCNIITSILKYVINDHDKLPNNYYKGDCSILKHGIQQNKSFKITPDVRIIFFFRSILLSYH